MRTRHLLLAIGLAAVWGFNFVVMEVGLQHFPPLFYVALRFLVAAFPALLFVGGPGVPWRNVLAAAATLGCGQYALLLLGMRAGMPAGLTSLVIQVQAVFTVIMAVFLLGERITARRVTGMTVAFAGLALVAVDLGTGGPVGAFLLVVGAALLWGMGNIAVRKAAPPDSFRFMVWLSAVSALPMLALSLAVEGVPDLEFSVAGSLSVLYVALISTLGGFGVWGFLLQRYDASLVAPYSLLVPVFGMSSAALFTGEPTSPLKLVAALLILSGVLYAGTRPRRAPAPFSPSPDASQENAARETEKI
ncbi:O-acetylserine/cysteine efflux transporter [Streptosporangium becharense]|uniref:O-acetylserine/cysteine efflux transporter n=1 Tax=Streptosporangium becharense TaxID=1816182 RepID=A0A7W9IGF8_9ACTN|nr:EamA family transporter [Streptosporangium becharense]MBB2909032.1 O-acetylserine/cysteine efflux transporter [Streptosporangium becharense]MBB5819950.1 O-acetylserine/cysteine efflux transporter [Streptosporangium becharense]